MPLGEFDLIAQFFDVPTHDDSVVLGIGDDAAIVQVPNGQQLLISTDTLNCGIHFPQQTSAADIAFKTVAVNISDLAAMGATPKWATLNLSVPSVDPQWLREFAASLHQQLAAFGVTLIGGDTTRGPLSLTLTVMGVVADGKALRRDRAQVGDLIVVSGTVGDARLGLELALQKTTVNDSAHRDYLVQRLNQPTARIQHSGVIRDVAHAAIDISDGLAQDLSHILRRSHCGAVIDVEKLPLSSALRFSLSEKQAWQYALAGGDDYELLFTVAPKDWPSLEQRLYQQSLTATVIGRMVAPSGLQLRVDGKAVQMDSQGFQHF